MSEDILPDYKGFYNPETESPPPSKLEKARREVSSSFVEAGVLLATALVSQDMEPGTRAIVMLSGTAAAAGLGLKMEKGRGAINGGIGEMAKTGLLGVAAAFAVDHPEVTMAGIENVMQTGSSITPDQGGNILKGIAATGALAIGGWGLAKGTVKTYELATRGIEKAKESAKAASVNVLTSIGDRINSLTDPYYLEKNGRVPSRTSDFRNFPVSKPIEPDENDPYRNPDNFTQPRRRMPYKIKVRD